MTTRSFASLALAGFLAFSGVGAAWAAPEAAATPHAAVASVAVVGQAVSVTGGGFKPGEVVTLRIIGPSRRTDMAAVVATGNGTISHEMVAASPGAYRILVIDAAGKALPNELRLLASR